MKFSDRKPLAFAVERECVEAWPECWPGEYDPRCCRFPKSCSVTVKEPGKELIDYITERLDHEMYMHCAYYDHEYIWGVPCGPTLSMTGR